ncbi:MAG: oxidoreductase [Epsilonproteobacteria bacterium]|nr:MAG: oxidoreductase [Campylobacterota bacterium]
MKAYVVEQVEPKKFISSIQEVDIPTITQDEVLICSSHSSLNYKDALSSVGNPGVSRNFPHITGIDVAGTITQTNSKEFNIGDKVVVTGYDLGMNTKGGHSQYVKVPAAWVVKLPDGLSQKQSMIYGTAGFTASLCVDALLANGIKNGKILVSGATGGVGSISITILSKLGFEPIAITSKKEKIPFLKSIGAIEVLLTGDMDTQNKKPLLSEQYDGMIDTLGGDILAHSLKAIRYDGVVACCGIAASFELHTTMFAFILRAVKLIGIDSVQCPIEKKRAVWHKIASEFRIDDNILENLTTHIELEDIKPIYDKMLSGQITGRYLVNIS